MWSIILSSESVSRTLLSGVLVSSALSTRAMAGCDKNLHGSQILFCDWLFLGSSNQNILNSYLNSLEKSFKDLFVFLCMYVHACVYVPCTYRYQWKENTRCPGARIIGRCDKCRGQNLGSLGEQRLFLTTGQSLQILCLTFDCTLLNSQFRFF